MIKIVSFFNKYPFIFPLLLMVSIFFLTTRVDVNKDTWFHMMIGEYIMKYGIFHKDIFSFTAYGREWFPYEWFFQVCIFWWKQLFGINAINTFTGFFTSLSMGCLYLLFRKIFRLNALLCAWIILFFLLFSILAISGRPQIFSLLFIVINLGLILHYLQNKKNLLFLSIPITLLWVNSHASIILDVYLFGAYTFAAFGKRFFIHNAPKKEWQTLGIYTLITAVVTMLPPLWTLQYRLLLFFWHYNTTLTTTLLEWQSIFNNYTPGQVALFAATILMTVFLTVFVIVRKKLYSQIILFLPLVIFLILPFLSFRNLIYSYLVISIMLGFIFSSIPWGMRRLIKIPLVLFFTLSFAFFAYLLWIAHVININNYLPVKATEFIKTYHVQGNMFNEIEDGGYLMYSLYPTKKMFIDTRFDLYACCETQIWNQLLTHANDSDSAFLHLTNQLIFNKYPISFVLVNTKKGKITERMSQVLQTDPTWNLIYWDDINEIFVKKDGKNTKLLKEFGTQVATPYAALPFQPKDVKQALGEYQKMIQVTDSARSRNALGDAYLVFNNIPEAEAQFEKAIMLDPHFYLPYINLGELALLDGNSQIALTLFEAAERLNPTQPTSYIRIAEIYVKYQQDFQKARSILERGLQIVQTQEEKQTIQNVLLQMQNLQTQ